MKQLLDIPIRPESIPEELKEHKQWVCWRTEPGKNGRPEKILVNPRTLRNASSTDSATWDTFEKSLAVHKAHSNKDRKDWLPGIGFVVSDADPYVFIDFDECRSVETGETEPWALALLAELDSYSEISPTGTGWHVVVRGRMTGTRHKIAHVEIYSSIRFMTATGWTDDGVGRLTVEERDLRSFEERFAKKQLGPQETKPKETKPKGTKPKKSNRDESNRDESSSAVDWRLLITLADETGAKDADALEAALRAKDPQRFAEQNKKKGDRCGKTYFRYTIEKFFEDKEERGLLGPPFNDTGNAARLLMVYGDELLYVPPWKKWLHWDGSRWLLDEKGKIREMARRAIKKFGAKAFEQENKDAIDFARKSLNTASISNAIHEAKDQRAVMPAELDTDRDLLNFTNGTLNLQTGVLSPHNPEQRITKLVDCAYNPKAKCPTFISFLGRAVGGDQLRFLLRALGLTLTGHTGEKKAFVCHGETDTGKTTLLNLLSEHLLPEYSTLINADSLMQRSHQDANALSDLADLCSKRFAQTSETREGQRLDESTLKRIIPGEALIRAVRKYELPFTFSATHKLWVDTNYEIVMTGTGDDVWGRIVPFKFGPRVAELDRELPAKLRAEIEGIFALLCDEAKQWYKEGLGELPETMKKTRAAWKSEADRVRRFIAECCDRGPEFQTAPRALYKGYNLWDKDGGEKPMTETMFGRKLGELAKELDFRRAERVYEGIDLQPVMKIRLEGIANREAGIVVHAQARGSRA